MREKVEELEDEKVDVRKEDRTIRPFEIPHQEMLGELVNISSYTVIGKNHKPVARKAHISLKRGQHLLLRGPNGIGKSTLLEAMARGTASGTKITDGVKVGYYRQDFSTLNFDETVLKSLMTAAGGFDQERVRAVASGFLITSDVIDTKIGSLSEGQKGLVAFARLVLEKPGFLILDEPTNHINFRHLPLIAKALSEYKGAMILVSHVPEFVAQIRMDETLDLEK
jgi:ATP-binding cassette subfamily F protein 3